MSLTTAATEKARPGVKPDGRVTNKLYRIFDSRGFYLEVSPGGGKWWRLKYRYAQKEKRLSLGVYPAVSLRQARKRRDVYRAMLARGFDPSVRVKTERAARKAQAERQAAARRFTLDSAGALLIRVGRRRLSLAPGETTDLRNFLNGSRIAKGGVISCR